MFHYNEELCQKCGGACCKRMPGCAIPEDIAKLFPAETIQESVKQALLSKKWSIDWWEDINPIYFLRPATSIEKIEDALLRNILEKMITKKSNIFDASWGGTCIYLEKNGCSIPKELRPDQCKRLKPSITPEGLHNCDVVDNQSIQNNGKLHYANLWKDSGIDLYNIGQEVLEILNNN